MAQATSVDVALFQVADSTTAVRELVDQYLYYGTYVAQHAPKTVSTRRGHLGFFVAYCDKVGIRTIDQLNNLAIDAFFAEYSATRQKSTVNTARRILKVFLRWVDGYKEIKTRAKPDAIQLVRTKKTLPKALSDHLIIQAINGAKYEQDRLMLALLREGGLRATEITNVRVKDVLLDQVRVDGKGDTEEMVYITPALASALRRFAVSEQRSPDDWLFQNLYKGYGGKMDARTIWRRVKRCFEVACGMKAYPHQLRHTMAVEMLKSGADIVSIQRQLRHEDLKTTQVYLRLDDSYIREVYARSMPQSILDH